jgi:hypothetical protein
MTPYRFGERTCDGPQSFGSLGGCLDVGHVVRMQCRCCRNHDRKRDEVRKSHANEGVEMNSVERAFALERRPL